MLANFTASLGNHQSIQDLGSQMPALISIDKGRGGMSKCKTFPFKIELREAAWCREEVESRTSGLCLLLALLPACFLTWFKLLFLLCYLTFCEAGRARPLSHSALGRCRDFLGDRDLSWHIHTQYSRQCCLVIGIPKCAGGVAVLLETQRAHYRALHLCKDLPIGTRNQSLCYYRWESHSESGVFSLLHIYLTISYLIYYTVPWERHLFLG